MTRLFHILLSALIILVFAMPAYAGKRKVTTYEYDNRGNQIKTQVYDDVGSNAQLVSESETEYDSFNNVIAETQKRVLGYDRDTAVVDYETIVQRYAYEDINWPTKPTKKYNPRFEDDADPDQYAQQFYYDRDTGLLELSFSSHYDCTDPARGGTPNALTKISGLERGNQSLEIDLRLSGFCAANSAQYDTLGRPTETKSSLALHYAAVSGLEDRTWIETEYDYYSIGSPQKGALERSIQGADGEEFRIYTAYNWDAVGNLISTTNNGQTGTLGYITSAEYDALRRVTKVIDAKGGESRYAYDPAGRLRAISKKLDTGWALSRAAYLDNGQLDTVTDPDGDITYYSYDAAGRADVVTDGAGRKVKTIYYANGQTKCTIKGYGSALVQGYSMYDYFADGQVKAIRPAKGVQLNHAITPTDCSAINDTYDTSYSYDGYRRLHETVFPKRAEDADETYKTHAGFARGAGHTYTRQWLDQIGNALQRRTRRGKLHTLYYRANNQLYRRNTKEGFYLNFWLSNDFLYQSRFYPYLNGSYDPVYSVNNIRTVSTGFDGLGRIRYELHREDYGDHSGSSYVGVGIAHDEAGIPADYNYTGDASTKYEYDELGMMTSVGFASTWEAPRREIASFDYDIAGRRIAAYRGDKTQTRSVPAIGNLPANANFPAYSFTSYNYDADGDLKQLYPRYGKTDQHTAGLIGFVYRYDQEDGSGKITKAYTNSPGWRYTPDMNTVADYGAVNALDQYDAVDLDDGAGLRVMDHDGAGNLTSDGNGRVYEYNSENQLIRATGTAAGDIFDMEYRYDSLGRRSHSLDYILGTETLHLHLGDMEIGDYEVTRESGLPGEGKILTPALGGYTPIFNIILGQGTDERIAYYDVDGDDLSFYTTNHQGSTVLMTEENGELLPYPSGGRYVYDPYGREMSGASEAGNPYRYTGRRYDAQTGLYYYRARYYSPELGKFLQTDPIGYADQMNLYGYVMNDPINFVDPSGLECNSAIYPTIPTGELAPRTDCVDGDPGDDGGPAEPPQPGDVPPNGMVDEIVVNGVRESKNTPCEGVGCLHLPKGDELIGIITPDGSFTDITSTSATPFEGTSKCTGKPVSGLRLNRSAFNGAIGAAHGHNNKNKYGDKMKPNQSGPDDIIIPRSLGIPNVFVGSNVSGIVEITSGQPHVRAVQGTFTSAQKKAIRAQLAAWKKTGC